MDLDQLQFSGWTLFFGFAFGTFGFWMLKRAKDRSNAGLFFIGLALLIYPYFVVNPWLCFLIGAGLCFGAYRIW